MTASHSGKLIRKRKMYILLPLTERLMELKDNSKVISPREMERDLEKLLMRIQAAHRSSIDVKKSYDLYSLAFKELVRGNEIDAFMQSDHATYELTDAVNVAKLNVQGLRIHSIKTLSFFFKLYGIYAMIFGALAILFFSLMIFHYSNFKVLDVPLWASFFAGLGSSAQILSGVVDDLRQGGMVIRYKRLWYMALPLLGMIFGYMAYLLFLSGLIAFNANSQNSVFSTMLFCFFTGFATNWLISKLSGLSRDL